MNRFFWQTAKIAPVFFAALFAANGVNAQTISADREGVNNTLQQINNYQQLDQGDLSQVTNVNQLRDVSPTDWAYEALRSLVDRYGCISGFPNQTYRGNQPLSRYEFAAGLNSCLNQIERLIASQDAIGQEDLDTINRLTQEFEAELATIGGRVDELESRTAVLEDSQFSTTTKLNGEAIFGLGAAFGGGTNALNSAENNIVNTFGLGDEDDIDDTFIQANIGDLNGDGDFDDDDVALTLVGDADGDGDLDEDDIDEFEDETEIDDELTFSSRVRLNFDSSFFGQDRLRARLEAGNFDRFNTTNSARFGFDTNTINEGGAFNIILDDLHYRFPVGERANVWIGPKGLDLDDIFAVNNPMLESGSTGALSRFSRRNPITLRGTEGAGAGVNIDIIPDRVGVNVGYLTDEAENPDEGQGLFAGSFSAGAQLEVSPVEFLDLNLTYVRNFQTADSVNQSGSTVSLDDAIGGFATDPFGIDTISNKFGGGVSLDLGRIVVAGWAGYADVQGILDGDDNNPNGNILSAGGNISLLDLVKEGSMLSIAGGIIPKFTADLDNDENQAALTAFNDPNVDTGTFTGVNEDPDTSFLLEALYRFPLNDNISITPGVFAVFNPNHNDNNDTVVVGAVRTTFKF